MERELWPIVDQTLREVARGVQQKYVHYPPWVIAAVLLWAALHDRPVAWACDRRNWSTTRPRPRVLSSAATVSRRAVRTAFAVFLNHLAARLKGDGPGPQPSWVRRQVRVERWVWCTLVINSARILNRRHEKEHWQ